MSFWKSLQQSRTMRAGVLGSAAILVLLSGPAKADYISQTNLVSNGAVPAATIDPNLVNPWGLSYGPGGPFWVSDNGTGLTTLYNGAGGLVQVAGLAAIGVAPPIGSSATSTPTGQVFNNGGATDFVVSGSGKSGKSAFIFATEDGTISGWSPGVNIGSSIIAVDNSKTGAVYKGLAIGNTGGQNFLYAANFNSGKVEIYDHNFAFVKSVTDPMIPAGYAPFNVQVLDAKLYVTYALQDATKHDDVSGAGHGFIDEFELTGSFIGRVASGGVLDSPWGLDLAPASFGSFANDLLVGNFGDGTINVFDPTSDAFLGTLNGANGTAVAIDGLWALVNGNGGLGGSADTVYFSAGPNDEADGLLGSLTFVPEAPSWTILCAGLILVGITIRPTTWRIVR